MSAQKRQKSDKFNKKDPDEETKEIIDIISNDDAQPSPGCVLNYSQKLNDPTYFYKESSSKGIFSKLEIAIRKESNALLKNINQMQTLFLTNRVRLYEIRRQSTPLYIHDEQEDTGDDNAKRRKISSQDPKASPTLGTFPKSSSIPIPRSAPSGSGASSSREKLPIDLSYLSTFGYSAPSGSGASSSREKLPIELSYLSTFGYSAPSGSGASSSSRKPPDEAKKMGSEVKRGVTLKTLSTLRENDTDGNHTDGTLESSSPDSSKKRRSTEEIPPIPEIEAPKGRTKMVQNLNPIRTGCDIGRFSFVQLLAEIKKSLPIWKIKEAALVQKNAARPHTRGRPPGAFDEFQRKLTREMTALAVHHFTADKIAKEKENKGVPEDPAEKKRRENAYKTTAHNVYALLEIQDCTWKNPENLT